MKKTLLLSLVCSAALFTIAPGQPRAHDGAMGVVKERMVAMGLAGNAMKQLKAQFADQARYSGAKTAELAGVIEEMAGEKLIKLFPQGSLQSPTEALPTIWEQPEKFKSLANELVSKAQSLRNSADSLPKSRMNFVLLAKTCSGCHTEFRKKKQ